MRKFLVMFVAMMCAIASFAAQPAAAGSGHQGKQGKQNVKDEQLFEQAVSTIKKYETLHKPQHWPYVGYGHRVQKGDKYRQGIQLTERQADAQLRKDLQKFVDLYSSFGKDSILLGALAYNIGPVAVGKSSFFKMLKRGIRTPNALKEAYTAMCRFKGKVHKQLQNRRVTEFTKLFVE